MTHSSIQSLENEKLETLTTFIAWILSYLSGAGNKI